MTHLDAGICSSLLAFVFVFFVVPETKYVLSFAPGVLPQICRCKALPHFEEVLCKKIFRY